MSGYKREVGTEEMRDWVRSLIADQPKGDGTPDWMPTLPVALNPFLTENAMLTRNSEGKALQLFIRRENDLIVLDLKLEHP